MASMTHATATGITATRHSSRKGRRELLRGTQHVTTDPNDLIDSDKEEGHQRNDTKARTEGYIPKSTIPSIN
jgi:hypothetical protein